MAARALASTDHPLLAHIIPMRRCNLACTYCNEFDDFSKPVPIEEMFRRIDKLGALGTSVVTISRRRAAACIPNSMRSSAAFARNGMIAGLITNGYLLVAERIQRLNRAGLEWLQISIDNVNPDEVSKKSLKVLDKKLQLLAEHADFHVNINSVVGGGISHPQDALVIGKRAVELGFTSTIGIIHDGSGQLQPLGEEERHIYHEMQALEKSSFTRVHAFQDNIAKGLPNDWRCRAGARYLYICEDGLVHYCSQQRGYPGVPLATYTHDDLRREYRDREIVCAALYGFVRASGFHLRFVARTAASSPCSACGFADQRTCADQVDSLVKDRSCTPLGLDHFPSYPGLAPLRLRSGQALGCILSLLRGYRLWHCSTLSLPDQTESARLAVARR